MNMMRLSGQKFIVSTAICGSQKIKLLTKHIMPPILQEMENTGEVDFIFRFLHRRLWWQVDFGSLTGMIFFTFVRESWGTQIYYVKHSNNRISSTVLRSEEHTSELQSRG